MFNMGLKRKGKRAGGKTCETTDALTNYKTNKQ